MLDGHEWIPGFLIGGFKSILNTDGTLLSDVFILIHVHMFYVCFCMNRNIEGTCTFSTCWHSMTWSIGVDFIPNSEPFPASRYLSLMFPHFHMCNHVHLYTEHMHVTLGSGCRKPHLIELEPLVVDAGSRQCFDLVILGSQMEVCN